MNKSLLRFIKISTKLKTSCSNYADINLKNLRTNLKIFNSIWTSKTSLLNILEMSSTRHVQTQHGISSMDDGNIILCKANLFSNVVENKTDDLKESKDIEEKSNGAENTDPQCVWHYDEGFHAEPIPKNEAINLAVDQQVAEENEMLEQFIEKRKAEDSTDIFRDVKKAKLETKVLKAQRPGFTQERYNETSYYMENGLRKVYPYYFTFTTFTKGRWVGDNILDVFAREFRAHPAEEYERSINSGSLTVNYEKVPIDYKLQHNDLLANKVHRHEVPVTSEKITIVHMDDHIVVINKPASIPVHPCGRYRHNTVVFIMAKEYNLKNLRTIHRLDRLTSGLLLFGRSADKARQLEQEIRNRLVQKEYVCRVEGDFPDGLIDCSQPIEVVSYKIGVCKVSPKGKDCSTTFRKLSYNGKTSVVLCKPLTGRMHQIRVHLQYLGYPIINDPLYNHEVFGPLKGKGGDFGGKTAEQLISDLISVHNAENWLGIDGDADISMFKPVKANGELTEAKQTEKVQTADNSSETASDQIISPTPTDSSNKELPNEQISITHPKETGIGTQTDHDSPDLAFDAEKLTVEPNCYECKVRFKDPKPNDLVMYLHAWKYSGTDWGYETKLPQWAAEDWQDTK